MNNIAIVLDGSEYVSFKSIQVHMSFLNICREFQATITLSDELTNDYPVKIGQKFIVKVNGVNAASGYIEKISIRQDNEGRSIGIYGRDYLADLLDSTIDASVLQPFNGNISFATLCRSVIKTLGIAVLVKDTSGITEIFKQDDYITPDVGERCSDYLQKYADKMQVFLNSDGDGNLLIRRSNTAQSIDNYLSMRPMDNTNRILSSNTVYDDTALFNQYRCHCQQQTLNTYTSQIETAIGFENDIVGILGSARNNNVRSSRIYNFISSTSMDQNSATNRAIWQSNYHNSKYLTYQCVVSGYSYSGNDQNIWQPNMSVHITDYYANIDATMLLSSVVFKLDSDGYKTQLCFVPPDSFKLQAERSDSSKSSQQLGKVYGSDQ